MGELRFAEVRRADGSVPTPEEVIEALPGSVDEGSEDGLWWVSHPGGAVGGLVVSRPMLEMLHEALERRGSS
mgnify:FL=1